MCIRDRIIGTPHWATILDRIMKNEAAVCDIYLFSSLSFSVYYVFKSRMCKPNVRIHLASAFIFCSFLSPSWRFVLQTEILGKCNSSFRWSKLPNLQMHRKLGFIWKTYAQPAIGVIGIPRGPPGVCPTQIPRSQLFFIQFKDAFIITFQRPHLY